MSLSVFTDRCVSNLTLVSSLFTSVVEWAVSVGPSSFFTLPLGSGSSECSDRVSFFIASISAMYNRSYARHYPKRNVDVL